MFILKTIFGFIGFIYYLPTLFFSRFVVTVLKEDNFDILEMQFFFTLRGAEKFVEYKEGLGEGSKIFIIEQKKPYTIFVKVFEIIDSLKSEKKG